MCDGRRGERKECYTSLFKIGFYLLWGLLVYTINTGFSGHISDWIGISFVQHYIWMPTSCLIAMLIVNLAGYSLRSALYLQLLSIDLLALQQPSQFLAKITGPFIILTAHSFACSLRPCAAESLPFALRQFIVLILLTSNYPSYLP